MKACTQMPRQIASQHGNAVLQRRIFVPWRTQRYARLGAAHSRKDLLGKDSVSQQPFRGQRTLQIIAGQAQLLHSPGDKHDQAMFACNTKNCGPDSRTHHLKRLMVDGMHGSYWPLQAAHLELWKSSTPGATRQRAPQPVVR
jgi:hypothetical protein